MSRHLIAKIGTKLAVDQHCYLSPKDLPPFWRKTPSNLAYRIRQVTGWNVKGKRDKTTGYIHFHRVLPRKKKNKTNIIQWPIPSTNATRTLN